MRKYCKNFLSFNGHPHIVNFIQIYISLYFSSFSTKHTQTTIYYIEVFHHIIFFFPCSLWHLSLSSFHLSLFPFPFSPFPFPCPRPTISLPFVLISFLWPTITPSFSLTPCFLPLLGYGF